VETGLRLASTESYVGLDPQQVAAEGAGFYRLDPTGLMQLRDERLPLLISEKDVGLALPDRLTVRWRAMAACTPTGWTPLGGYPPRNCPMRRMSPGSSATVPNCSRGAVGSAH
jgi:hypothetical protein